MRYSCYTLLLLFSGPLLRVASGAEKITYDDHIFPLLESNCLNCHNPDKKKGGLDLSSYDALLSGGSGGKIVKTGDGASSKLYTVSVHTEEPVMPPEGDQMGKKETDLLRAWIDGGLLETQSSKKKKPKKPSFDLAPVTDAQTRPEGPLPMPAGMSREPVIVTARSTVIKDMEASPWAPVLAITGQRQILLYHTDQLELLGVLPFPYGQPESLAFHPNGKYLIAGGGIAGKSGTTVTWDITTGKVLMEQGREFDAVLAADIHPDLGTLALGGPSKTLKIWDTQKVEERFRIKKHSDWITSLRFSPDGKLLATGDRNNGIHLWESTSGEEVYNFDGHAEAITEVKWRSDSKVLLTASADAHLILWDTQRGQEIKKIKAHDQGLLAMDNSRQGLIVTSGRDRKVKFWKHDLGFKQELPQFQEEITEVEFSHDGKHVFTADWNGTITAWTTEGFKVIGNLESNPPQIKDRLVLLSKKKDHLEEKIREKKNSLTEQETLLAASSDPDPLTEKLVATLKGEHGLLHQQKAELEMKIKSWQSELANLDPKADH